MEDRAAFVRCPVSAPVANDQEHHIDGFHWLRYGLRHRDLARDESVFGSARFCKLGTASGETLLTCGDDVGNSVTGDGRDDHLHSARGAHTIEAGDGNDQIQGQDGDDAWPGDKVCDTPFAGLGDDVLSKPLSQTDILAAAPIAIGDAASAANAAGAVGPALWRAAA